MTKDTAVLQGEFFFKFKDSSKEKEFSLKNIALDIRILIERHFDTNDYLDYFHKGCNSGEKIDTIDIDSIKNTNFERGEAISFYYHGERKRFNMEVIAEHLADLFTRYSTKQSVSFKDIELIFRYDATYLSKESVKIKKNEARLAFELVDGSSKKLKGFVKDIKSESVPVGVIQMYMSNRIFTFEPHSNIGVGNLIKLLEDKLTIPENFNSSYSFKNEQIKMLAQELVAHLGKNMIAESKMKYNIDIFTLAEYIKNNSKERLYLGEKETMPFFNEIAPKIGLELMTKGTLSI